MIDFSLLNVDNKVYDSEDLLGHKGTLVMFICNHCPYVKAVLPRLIETTVKLNGIGINSIAIMPNDTKKYPEDNFENMKIFSKSNNFNFPYLIDDKQEVAKKFGAVCTPDFFGFNKNKFLQYRGRLSEIKNLEFVNSRNELFDAMKMISETQNGPSEQYSSIGCSIKWK